MLFLIFFTTLLYILYRFKGPLRQGYLFYKSYKLVVDPDGSKGHWNTLWSIGALVFQLTTGKSGHVVDNNMQHEKLNGKYLKIPFRYQDHRYFYLLKVPRGVVPIRNAVDESDRDVTDEIVPYLGPNLDCCKSGVTPADFGYKKLKITTVLDRVAEFEENDVITFA